MEAGVLLILLLAMANGVTASAPTSSSASSNMFSLLVLVVIAGTQQPVDASVVLIRLGTSAYWQGTTTNGEIWFKDLPTGVYAIQLSGIANGCQTNAGWEVHLTSSSVVLVPVACP